MEKAKIINSGSSTPDSSYFSWLKDVKDKLHRPQIKASLRINQAMLEFYWELGHDIDTLQKSHAWGSGFFERLSHLINRYQAGNDLNNDTLPEILAYIPWRHHIDILRKCKDVQYKI